MNIKFNDAWEGLPLDCVDDCIRFLDARLQDVHPLKSRRLLPVGKRWREDKYLIADEGDISILWVLDMGRKKSVGGKSCYYFKQIQTQQELDDLLRIDYDIWVQEMKGMGAWSEE